jgi:hypothetical protein
MVLNIEKTAEDARGKIMFISYGNKKVNLVEIKKNFARGVVTIITFHQSMLLSWVKLNTGKKILKQKKKKSKLLLHHI